MGDLVVIGFVASDNYCYVYNKSDRSCLYRRIGDYKDAPCVRFNEMYDNISRLRILGFKYNKHNNSYSSYLCEYMLNEFNIVLYICADVNSTCCLVAIIDLCDTIEVKTLSILAKYGFIPMGRNKIGILIPKEMIDYLLHLKSLNNFDKVIGAFDGLLGCRLKEIVPKVGIGKPVFNKWL